MDPKESATPGRGSGPLRRPITLLMMERKQILFFLLVEKIQKMKLVMEIDHFMIFKPVLREKLVMEAKFNKH